MQACLRARRWDAPWVDARIEEAARAALGDLMRLGVDVDQAKREVWARAGGLATFAARYMADEPKVRTHSSLERRPS